MKHISYQWVLFYIEIKYYKNINKELKEKGYKHIRAIVPTLKIFKKRHKGKDIYEEVPLLFNYGFMKMPTDKAFSRTFLNKLSKSISGIRTFVKSTSTMHPRKKKARIDNAEDFDDFSIVATVNREEVKRFKKLSKNEPFSKEDLSHLEPGTYLTLKSYPYEGVPAVIRSIDILRQKVNVFIYPQDSNLVAEVPIENVLYSIYNDYDEDKLYVNNLEDNSDSITEESINDFLNRKRL